jgi:hypothetical protein
MFAQAYGTAIVIVLLAVLLGRAICALAGGNETWWGAPAVGLAALIIVAGAAIQLPGREVTAVVLVCVVSVAAVVYVVRSKVVVLRRGELLIGLLAIAGASIPFIASGRIGLQGVSLDNDTTSHLLNAEALRSTRMDALWGAHNGYPLGPHSLVVTLASPLHEPLDLAFAGLLLGVVPITALVAAGVVADEKLWRRAVTGVVSSLAYLAAAYYAEGAFKETILACLLLAFAVHLNQVRARWALASATRAWCSVLPSVLLAAGAVYTYSYVGLTWFAVTVALWAVAETVYRPSLLLGWLSARRLRRTAPWLAGTVVLGLLVLLPVAGQALTFFRSVGFSPSGAIPAAALGNLRAPLSPYEMFGIWVSQDFRGFPSNVFHAGELAAIAVAVALWGLWWSIRRRLFVLPAAAVGCSLIWLVSSHGQSPYVTAKALAIGSPIVMALGLRGLLSSQRGTASTRVFSLAAAAAFCSLAAYSSYQTLRSEPVQAPTATRDLAELHRITGNAPILFLGDDDYAPWQLRESAVSALASNTPSAGGVTARPNKPYVFATATDFDSVQPADLDHFRYVITSNSPYASQAPANFRLLATTPLYQLWQRTGPTVARQVIEPSGAPGAVLDCRSAAGRKLSHRPGEASVVRAPVTAPGPGLTAGGSAAVPLRLPPGQWDISLQYYGSFDLTVTSQGLRRTMPAYLGRPGPFFDVGRVMGNGTKTPVVLIFSVPRPSIVTGTGLFTAAPLIAATPVPAQRRLVPLSHACGQYVDWYRLS